MRDSLPSLARNGRPGKRVPWRRAFLTLETLEDRRLLSATLYPYIVLGNLTGSAADSQVNRVDLNTTTSPFAGVVSVRVQPNGANYYYLGSGTLLKDTDTSSFYVLTAAHMIDTNNNGTIDYTPGNVRINFNYGSDLSNTFTASALFIHPDWTGFNHPSVNDDLAILKFAGEPPAGVPEYSLYLGTDAMTTGTTAFTLVGYGQSGDGVNGYTVNASLTVKRKGQNVVDFFYGQDDRNKQAAKEVFEYDFDGNGKGHNYPGTDGAPLANDVETTLGGGDSGGPAFYFDGTNYLLAGVNTYGGNYSGEPAAPLFGSVAGGILLNSAYRSWINNLTGGGSDAGGGGPGGGKGGGGKPRFELVQDDSSLSGNAGDSRVSFSFGLPAQTHQPFDASSVVQQNSLSPERVAMVTAALAPAIREFQARPALAGPGSSARDDGSFDLLESVQDRANIGWAGGQDRTGNVHSAESLTQALASAARPFDELALTLSPSLVLAEAARAGQESPAAPATDVVAAEKAAPLSLAAALLGMQFWGVQFDERERRRLAAAALVTK